MQVLNLFRYDLPKAIATDWRQFWCGLRGRHVVQWTGTTYGSVKTGPGKWDFKIGRPLFRCGYCAKCNKSIKRKM